MSVTIEARLPTVSEFTALRRETRWGTPDPIITKTVLKRSFSGVVATDQNKVIGMARTVGDGCLILYIQDVVVTAPHRSKGVGRALIRAVIDEALTSCLPSCTIGLFAAMGQAGFYEKLGFHIRSTPSFGPAMQGTLSTLAKATNAA